MKFTLSWLKDHLETTATVEELATKLSSIGLEVERRRRSGQEARRLHDRPRGRGQAASQRRQAAGVQVEVAKGQPLVEVVCGAPNAKPA